MPRKAVSESASAAATACMAASVSGGTGGAGRRMTAARLPESAVPGVVKAAAVRRGRGGHPDFCSRFFAPAVGIPEDPVTGSAHCALGPYWAATLATPALTAVQLSRRGGVVHVGVPPGGRRVRLGGGVRVAVRGELTRWEA